MGAYVNRQEVAYLSGIEDGYAGNGPGSSYSRKSLLYRLYLEGYTVGAAQRVNRLRNSARVTPVRRWFRRLRRDSNAHQVRLHS